ncbi:GNAT family N-acetyltransferase [Actinomycetota bacterium]
MTDTPKCRYEIDLTAPRLHVDAPHIETRPLTSGDRDALAELLLDAYIGTIDYEGETISEAEAAVDDWLDDYPLLEHSYGAVLDGDLVSALLATTLDGAPFISIVMTSASHTGAGLGRGVTEATIQSLRDDGYQRVALYITEGNIPSELLFASCGAAPVRCR